MEVPRIVNMVEARYGLMEDGGDETACEWPTLAGLHKLVEIAFHKFEHEIELLVRREEKEIVEWNYVGVVWNTPQ